nr:MAG TPA: hypothetical protein [Caudoviricetes sp.]
MVPQKFIITVNKQLNSLYINSFSSVIKTIKINFIKFNINKNCI